MLASFWCQRRELAYGSKLRRAVSLVQFGQCAGGNRNNYQLTKMEQSQLRCRQWQAEIIEVFGNEFFRDLPRGAVRNRLKKTRLAKTYFTLGIFSGLALPLSGIPPKQVTWLPIPDHLTSVESACSLRPIVRVAACSSGQVHLCQTWTLWSVCTVARHPPMIRRASREPDDAGLSGDRTADLDEPSTVGNSSPVLASPVLRK
jgi:hypothetical protein